VKTTDTENPSRPSWLKPARWIWRIDTDGSMTEIGEDILMRAFGLNLRPELNAPSARVKSEEFRADSPLVTRTVATAGGRSFFE